MTVADLIAELRKFPGDAYVTAVTCCEGEPSRLTIYQGNVTMDCR